MAMAIGMDLYGTDLLDGPLTIRVPHPDAPVTVDRTRRIGITKATALDLRFSIAGSRFVSR